MATHAAVVTVAPRAPLEVHNIPSPRPVHNEVRVRQEWTTSGPLDLHKADGGLLVKHPEVLGGGVAGTVVEVGDQVRHLRVGDTVFGYGWRSEKEKAHQEYSVMSENILGKIPAAISMAEAVTIPTNLVTAFHTLTADFGMDLPWPKPLDYIPADARVPILVWGGSSSVGQYVIQVLRYYGYENIIAVSSKRQHRFLQSLGAGQTLDYSNLEALTANLKKLGRLPYILDCIGSQAGSVVPISKIAASGSKVAIMLPVIVRDATHDVEPLYSMDVSECADWAAGVEVRGVRTHFYLDNAFYAEHLQPNIMPALVEQGVIRPNAIRIVDGEAMLERAQRALDMLRNKQVSGEKLVWKIGDGA